MLVGMSTELCRLPTRQPDVLTGIIVGPAMGFMAAFIVDFILALFGHGGITVVGLNTLVIGAECALGYWVFRGLVRRSAHTAQISCVPAGASVIVTLFITTMLLIGIVALSNVYPARRAKPARWMRRRSLSRTRLRGSGQTIASSTR